MKSRFHALVLFALPFGFALLGTTACGDQGKGERKLLLKKLEAVELFGGIPERRKQVGAVRGLALKDEKARKLQQVCVKAHEALLEAESEQAKAKQALDSLEAGKGDPSQLEPRRLDIQQALMRSNDAVTKARSLFPRCNEGIMAMSLRGRSKRN